MNAHRCHAFTLCILLLSPLRLDAAVTIETAAMVLTFDGQGSMVQADICYPSCADESATRLELKQSEGIISFDQSSGTVWVQRQGVSRAQASREQQLHFTSADGQSITWIIPAQGYRIEADVVNTAALVVRGGAGFRPRPAAGFGNWLEQVRYVAVGSHGIQQVGLDEEPPGKVFTDWAGFRNRFWAVLVSGSGEREYELLTGADNADAVLRRNMDAREEQHVFFLGPVEPGELTAVDEILGKLLYAGLWFWLRWICFGLFHLLGWIQSLVPVWGVAIMLLSLAVHILMTPLSRAADHVQREVNATEARLEPELSRIRKTYRGEEQAARMLALYKSEGVSPLYSLKSMLGVAIVIPVFIGAFDMLAENIHLLNTDFLWIRDLSRPDALMPLPFSLPFFGADLNLLPFLMSGLSVVASLLHQPLAMSEEMRRRQMRNMLLLALAFFALFYTFPAGMVLYWSTNNLISAGKSLWFRRRYFDHDMSK